MMRLSARRLCGWVLFSSLLALSNIVSAANLPDFVELVEDVAPAVVKIQVSSQARAMQHPDMPPLEEIPEPFRRFFQLPEQQGRVQQGMGSGFIVAADGYVLTNHHVVAGADTIEVRLNDRREFDAKLVGSDPATDLALLKIDAKGLPTVRLGDSNQLKVGEWVLAIGSPFGLDYSVSQGIVSAIGRSLPNERNENYVPFIQTDVAINPGNSGGPLFNLRGEVVGINSQIYSRSGGYMGLSFAIPVSVAKPVIEQLKENGNVERGWLGVVIQEVDRELAKSFGLAKPEGALVAQVVPGGPASGANLREGDIITAFNGQRILFSSDLPHIVGLLKPGTKAKVTFVRNGKTLTETVEVGALPGSEGAKRGKKGNAKLAESSPLGLQTQALNKAQLSQLQLPYGVQVVAVAPNSAAARSGLRPGDVITQLGFAEVGSPEVLADVVKQLPSGSVQPIRFVRQGQAVFRSIVIE